MKMVEQCKKCMEYYCEQCDINTNCEQCDEPIHCQAEEYDGLSFCSYSCINDYKTDLEAI